MLTTGMAMLSFAAVPLYDMFCRITGYGGTIVEAEAESQTFGNRYFTITFNADINRNLPWGFEPTEKKIRVRTGQNRLTAYKAWSKADEPTTGMAVYNVTPHVAGPYLNKIQCFCFETQTLAAHQEVNMPISFFIDPEIENDPDLDGVTTLTLSYSFFANPE